MTNEACRAPAFLLFSGGSSRHLGRVGGTVRAVQTSQQPKDRARCITSRGRGEYDLAFISEFSWTHLAGFARPLEPRAAGTRAQSHLQVGPRGQKEKSQIMRPTTVEEALPPFPRVSHSATPLIPTMPFHHDANTESRENLAPRSDIWACAITPGLRQLPCTVPSL